MKPTPEEFNRLAGKAGYLPVYEKIMGDTLTPVSVYQALRGSSKHSYLLESVQQDEKLGRYSWIGLDPMMVFSSKGRSITVSTSGGQRNIDANPLDELFTVMEDFKPALLEDLLPYQGGVVGYFGYDNIRHFEDIPEKNPDQLKIPDSLFVLPRTVFVFDHLHQSITLITLVESSQPDAYDEGKRRITDLIELIADSKRKGALTPIEDRLEAPLQFSSNISKAEYIEAVEKAKHYILEGDIFQVVLSQRFSMEYQEDPFEVYRSLRRINPSPYLFYLDYGDFQIAGSSPEILVKRNRDRLTLRPIAGTRSRGKTEEEDQKLADELLNDPKELAEHMMLVDLGRNDLGRVSTFGTVHPTQFKFIENYSHVMHIVTNLEGEMAEDRTNADLIKATFPAGTLTGAPKVRAMEIIDELEVSKRGFYGGTVANIDFNGNFDSCIGIRSVVVKDNVAYVQAGAGIVADSNPEAEYEECLNKAKAVMKAIQFARRSQP